MPVFAHRIGWLSRAVTTLAFALAWGAPVEADPPEPFPLLLKAQRPNVPEPFTVELKAKRPDLPESFTVELEASRPDLPEPFSVELKATRPDLPEPFAIELKAKRPDLPEPFAVELKAKRPDVPETFTVELKAKRPDLPEPFIVELKATRPNVPAPFAVKLRAKRPAVPEPFPLSLQASRPDVPTPFTLSLRARRPGEDELAAAAEAALDDCRFNDSAALMKELPPGPRRTALVTRGRKAYQTEKQARTLISAAVGLEDNDKLKDAFDKFGEAKELTPCPQTIVAIESAMGRIGAKIAKAAERTAEKAEAALDDCRFNDSAALIRELPLGPRRSALVTLGRKAFQTERQTQSLIRAGKTLEDAGDLEGALAKFAEAAGLGACAQTIAAIEDAMGRIRTKIAEAAEGVATAATEEETRSCDVVGTWDFGRVGSGGMCKITLTTERGAFGNVMKSCHANESYWELVGDELLFKHRDGSVTSRLACKDDGRWEGPYVTHQDVPLQGITHFITRDVEPRAERYTCDVDTSMTSGENPFCSSYIERRSEFDWTLHIVNQDIVRGGFQKPANWDFGRFNTCKVLSHDSNEDCANWRGRNN